MTLEATQIVLRPVISEKSMDQSTVNKYTFAVADDANKMQIKAAVEELFSVTVLNVNVSTMKGKEKSRNRGRGRAWNLDLARTQGRDDQADADLGHARVVHRCLLGFDPRHRG